MDFGISLDPLAVSQRHELDDSESDEEEESQQQPSPHHVATDPAGGSDFLSGKALILGIGSTASVFVRSFVCLSETPTISLPAETVVEKGGRFSDPVPREIAAVELCGAEGSAEWAACAHSEELRVEYCNRWTEKVLGEGKPSHVVVYICRSLHEYFNPSTLHGDTSHVVRELQSSSWPHPPVGVALEPPNSVKGETAAILTQCELRGIPCSVSILYASSSLTETEKAVCLLPSLQRTAAAPGLPRGLLIRSEKEGELEVKRIQPKRRTDLTALYT